MPRYVSPVVDVPEWERVSADQPCPICGAAAGCEILEPAEEFVRCLVIASDWPVLGGGWLHRHAGHEPQP